MNDDKSAENDVSKLTHSVLIRFASNLRVTRTGIKSQIDIIGKLCLQASMFIFDHIFVKLAGNHEGIKSRMSSISGQIGPFTSELLALK